MVSLIARLVLAGVFAVAAIAKFRDPSGTRGSLSRFGVPAGLVRAAAIALPLVELAIAIALIPAATAAWAAVAAALLLLVFTGALISVLARGEEVECNCFGSIGSEPVSRLTVGRNAGLFALAVVAAVASFADTGPSPTAWIADLSAFEAFALVAIVLLALACALNFGFAWQLMKQNGRLRLELDALRGREGPEYTPPGAGIGDPAPAFELASLGGESVSLDQLLAGGRGLVIMFSDPHCAACDPLLPIIGAMQREAATEIPAVVIASGDPDASREKAEARNLGTVLVQDGFDLAEEYGVHGMPSVVHVAADGLIAETAIGGEASLDLLARLDAPFPQLDVLTVAHS